MRYSRGGQEGEGKKYKKENGEGERKIEGNR